jgi:hypothetical protein
MALGKRKRERQLDAFVASSDLPQSPGHPFYTALNRLLAENDFDSSSHDRAACRNCVLERSQRNSRCDTK